jgi:DNA repair photolyase
VTTKSALILRDLDILKEIDRHAIHAPDLQNKLDHGVIVSFSFSTLDPDIAATLEPGAPLPQERLETMRRCKEAGLMVGMNCIPTLPFISDSEEQLEQMVKVAKEYGADYILIGGLTLFGKDPADSKVLYRKFLERRYPHLVSQYRKLYRIFFSPPEDYTKSLNDKAERICNRYQLRRSILTS